MIGLQGRIRPHRPALRATLLGCGVLTIAVGYWLLAIATDAEAGTAIDRAFLGMGVVAAGAVVAIASRLL